MRTAVGHPWLQSLAVLVCQIACKTNVVMLQARHAPRQSCGQEALPAVSAGIEGQGRGE